MPRARPGPSARTQIPTDETHALPQLISAGEALTDLVTLGGGTWQTHPGGAAWNVARAMAALGARSAFAGVVGEDAFGDELWRASRAAGLNLRFMQRSPQPTLLAVVHQISPPAYQFLGENSADLHFEPLQLPIGWQAQLSWLHLGGIGLAHYPLDWRLLEMMHQARAAGVKISFDPTAHRVHQNPAYLAVFERVMVDANLITLSDEDLGFFFPHRSETDALQKLRRLNTRSPIIITRGGDGASLYHDGRRVDLPAPVVEIADTVGAGDALCAGMLVSVTEQLQAP